MLLALRTRRKPISWCVYLGSLKLRFDTRRVRGLRFQDPPLTTRPEPLIGPVGAIEEYRELFQSRPLPNVSTHIIIHSHCDSSHIHYEFACHYFDYTKPHWLVVISYRQVLPTAYTPTPPLWVTSPMQDMFSHITSSHLIDSTFSLLSNSTCWRSYDIDQLTLTG